MAILDFQRPEDVVVLEETPSFGRFQFRPLEQGYGTTIGNALRRVLLSSLEGYAITSVKIDGVDHEFDTIRGVKQNVAQIILNLKQVRFKARVEEVPAENVSVSISDQEEFTAGMISKFLTGFEVLNPSLVICNMARDVRFKMDLTLRKGRGYVPAEENEVEGSSFGVIAIDSIHTPIRNVMFKVENYRVSQKTDYEMLTLEIRTDGSITPKDALHEAATILMHHFALFANKDKMVLPSDDVRKEEEFTEDDQRMRQLLLTQLVDLNLSVRALNCLKGIYVSTVGDLVKQDKSDLLKIRNFGRKSLSELEELVDRMGLTFSMDVSKYKLDKE